jgi:hypothetical protein
VETRFHIWVVYASRNTQQASLSPRPWASASLVPCKMQWDSIPLVSPVPQFQQPSCSRQCSSEPSTLGRSGGDPPSRTPFTASLAQTIWTNDNNKGCWLVRLCGRDIIGLDQHRIEGILISWPVPVFIRDHSLWSDYEFSFLKAAFGYGVMLRVCTNWFHGEAEGF